MAQYDSSELIAQIKRIAMVPTSQALFTNQSFLDLATQELRLTLVPLVESVVEEYFVHYEDFTVTTSDPTITIPYTASGLRLRELWYMNDDGSIAGHVPRIDLTTVAQLSAGLVSPYYGQWGAFYMMNNEVHFWPAPQTNFTARLLFYRVPNELTETSNGGVIESIDYGTSTITLTATRPSVFTTGAVLDVIEPTLPYNLRRTAITITGTGSDTITVSDADTVDLAVGDYLYLQGKSGFIQYMPVEGYHFLAQAAAVKVLEALGDANGLDTAKKSLAQMAQGMLKVISPRTVGAPKKLSPVNTVFAASRIGWNGWR